MLLSKPNKIHFLYSLKIDFFYITDGFAKRFRTLMLSQIERGNTPITSMELYEYHKKEQIRSTKDTIFGQAFLIRQSNNMDQINDSTVKISVAKYDDQKH